MKYKDTVFPKMGRGKKTTKNFMLFFKNIPGEVCFLNCPSHRTKFELYYR